MPRSPESSYTSYRLPTGLLSVSLTLGCWLTGFAHSIQAASVATASIDSAASQQSQNSANTGSLDNTSSPSPALATAAQSVSTKGNSTASDSSITAGTVTSHQQRTTSELAITPVRPAPTLLAQIPSSANSIPGGMPVPWNASPPWMVPTASQPNAVPTGPVGSWIMMWVPYGSVPAPTPTPGQGSGQPGAIAYPVWSPFMMPAQMPLPSNGAMGALGSYPPVVTGGAPNSYPYPYQPYAYPPYPYQPYAYQPYQPYAYQPYPYGAAPGMPGSPYGMPMPQGIPVAPSAPYPLVSNPQPLAVPTVPSQQLGTVPPPPSQPIPVIPNASPVAPVVPSSASAVFQPSTAIAPAPATQFAPATPLSLQESTVTNTAAAPLVGLDDNAPLTPTNLNLQGLYVLQGSQSSARARLSGSTFLTPNLMAGGTLDLVSGPNLTSSDGVQITELYLATALPGAPGLRFRLGQLDMTSYFDRNSFAKDIGRDFFNPTFNSNPALLAGLNFNSSHPGGLVQWAVTDDLSLTASAFSSAAGISDFSLDGFAGEVAFRTGNLILRGTYLTSRDSQFQGTGDRLNSYGVNAEWFIPDANVGVFGRYGRINNTSTGLAVDTYSLGINALDLFMENDRLGLAYGRNLTTASVNGKTPDALEVFYDFEALPNIRIGFSFQQLNQFTESVAGFRIRGDLDLTPSLP